MQTIICKRTIIIINTGINGYVIQSIFHTIPLNSVDLYILFVLTQYFPLRLQTSAVAVLVATVVCINTLYNRNLSAVDLTKEPTTKLFLQFYLRFFKNSLNTLKISY